MKVFVLKILLIGLMSGSTPSFFSVNYLGKSSKYIEQYIKENIRSLKLNTTSTNTSYKYLKFEDRVNEITVLFFLTEDDICKFVRLMSDYSNINDMTEELNSLYTSVDKNNWKFTENNKEYLIKLEEGDWFFTITIKENSTGQDNGDNRTDKKS